MKRGCVPKFRFICDIRGVKGVRGLENLINLVIAHCSVLAGIWIYGV